WLTDFVCDALHPDLRRMLILTAMDNHDSAYRLLFSHPEMVRDLLLGFIPGDWVHELDMSTLEKVNGSGIPTGEQPQTGGYSTGTGPSDRLARAAGTKWSAPKSGGVGTAYNHSATIAARYTHPGNAGY